MEISLENLYVDIGACRINLSWCFRAQSWRVVPLIRLAMLALRLAQVRIRE